MCTSNFFKGSACLWRKYSMRKNLTCPYDRMQIEIFIFFGRIQEYIIVFRCSRANAVFCKKKKNLLQTYSFENRWQQFWAFSPRDMLISKPRRCFTKQSKRILKWRRMNFLRDTNDFTKRTDSRRSWSRQRRREPRPCSLLCTVLDRQECLGEDSEAEAECWKSGRVGVSSRFIVRRSQRRAEKWNLPL